MKEQKRLLAELRNVWDQRAELRSKIAAATKRQAAASAEIKDAAKLLSKLMGQIEGIERELLTGLTGLPLMDAAASKSEIESNGAVIPPLEQVLEEESDADAKEEVAAKAPAAAEETHPLNVDQALGRAITHAPKLGLLLVAGTATDDQIRDALKDWGTFRVGPPYRGPGLSWATTGGDNPRFFAGESARAGNWPMGKPELDGDALIRAVRKYLKLAKPRTPKQKEAVAIVGAHLEKVDQAANAESFVGDASEWADVVDPGGLPPLTSADLERELGHAIRAHGMLGSLRDPNQFLTTNDKILAFIGQHWPRSTVYTPPDKSHRKLGYTVQGGSVPGFWLGPRRDLRAKPTLSGSALVDRVRRVVAAAPETRKQAEALNNPGPKPHCIAPCGPWDDAEIRNAADDLGVSLAMVVICNKCNAARDRFTQPCPACKCPEYRIGERYPEFEEPAAVAPPKKRGRPSKSLSARGEPSRTTPTPPPA